MTVPQTPTRRSQRFQPTATPSSKHSDKNVIECKWTSEPIYVRRTNADLDFLTDEKDEQTSEEEEGEEMETVFYDTFWMKRKVTIHKTGPSRRTTAGKVEEQTYRVGDTIMVETDTLYLTKRPPSIGVIVSMWQTRIKGEITNRDASKMRIRVHWFLRPTELASIREKREHEEVRIYRSLNKLLI